MPIIVRPVGTIRCHAQPQKAFSRTHRREADRRRLSTYFLELGMQNVPHSKNPKNYKIQNMQNEREQLIISTSKHIPKILPPTQPDSFHLITIRFRIRNMNFVMYEWVD